MPGPRWRFWPQKREGERRGLRKFQGQLDGSGMGATPKMVGFPQQPWGFPTKNDHFGVFWGYHYHHLRKHPSLCCFS